jgi:uncharacterized protein
MVDMLIDLNGLRGNRAEFRLELATEQVDLETEGVSIGSTIKADILVERSADRIRVSGPAECDLKIDCIRCLEPVARSLKFDVEAGFVPEEHFSSESEHQVGGEDLSVDVYRDDSLDLAEIVREQILLNLPDGQLCGPDCKGLCEKCGSNRNLIDCDCKDEEIDPRWEALRSLK